MDGLSPIQELQTLERHANVCTALYLIPAAENETSRAQITTSHYWPKEAQAGKWKAIALYGSGPTGSVVLGWLEQHEQVLQEASDGYFGQGEWDERTAIRVDALQDLHPLER